MKNACFVFLPSSALVLWRDSLMSVSLGIKSMTPKGSRKSVKVDVKKEA